VCFNDQSAGNFKDFVMRLASGLVLGLVVSATVAAVACSEGQAVQPQQDAPPPAVPVTATAAVRKDMPLEVSVIGTVEAYSTVAVRAQMTGELTSVNFQQGDDVRAGQELFTLDRRPLEAAMQQAAANLERDSAQAANAKVIVQRYEELVQRGIVAREQRDTARATVAALEGTLAADRAALENAKVQLQYATIRAPISGRTGALMVSVGNLVRANDQTPLVVINQVTPIYVSFAFPEALLSDLRRYRAQGSLRVEASLTSGDGSRAVGRITFVDNAVDQTTGTIKIKGTFPNEDRWLWPGQFVNVVVRLATESAAIVVPSIAVQTGPSGDYVFLVKADETVELRPITVARVAGTESVIRDGLAAGDRVVTDGHLRLVPGSRVSLRDAGAAKAGS
jgi:membrane fusion protein, multidrug efflux system